ncbi:YqiA/YcfP family alpha/beta fold hydrolase [Cyanobacterium aponinum UTEX 3222]|uniref:YqiA/YcfP family alpha/beta fold hydrolase n=1 Tax=Cyanobacterium aponinum TaxID=379064 RepID=UPI001680E514|nr:YqiA/YcfP family alpha/beta fold hydrolase [Cyanobacterium aponinum]MBD2394393.1 alpha/beta fold hydrolase [Cyanobacterium aponinum FACHB-4101]WRL42549.1 YqiA/YcfP family alpha/beta fold hydrolase [Cyanobacterium aponinum UTEX 3222]
MSNYLHLYLHGFASSPNSTKALYFQQRYQEINTPLAIMDFNQPDFTNLSLSRQINQVTKVITEKQESWEGQKIHPQFILIGSSFGGLTASWVAHNNPDKIKALILLAPAFNFALHLKKLQTQEAFIQWQKDGFFSIYHYGYKQQMSLNYNFWTDLLSYDESLINHSIPTLIFHGINDETIPIQSSRDYLKKHNNATLIELNSDHSLNNCLDNIWQELQLFWKSL